MSDQPPPQASWWRWLRGPITPGAAHAIVALFILSFLLAGACFWLSVRTVHGDIASRASVVQLCQASNDSRRALFLVSFLLAGASYWLSLRTVRGEIASRASVVQLCQAGNDSRAQQVTLWTHLVQMSTPPPHETAAQKARREKVVRDFLAYVEKVFMSRDCTASFKG